MDEAEWALETWSTMWYLLHWLAHWPLLAVALRQKRLPYAITAARAMLDPMQQQPPEELDKVLGTAVAAWEAIDEEKVQSCLKTAVQLAPQHGYL